MARSVSRARTARLGREDAWVEGGKGGWQLPVTVLGYVPRFEEASGLWYADIEVNADKSYLPFFRLAVGRFLPNSLTDEVCLSRVSTIDFVQPLPSRLLTVLRHGTTDPVITVTLRGCTYIGNSAEIPSRRGHRGAVLRRTR